MVLLMFSLAHIISDCHCLIGIVTIYYNKRDHVSSSNSMNN